MRREIPQGLRDFDFPMPLGRAEKVAFESLPFLRGKPLADIAVRELILGHLQLFKEPRLGQEALLDAPPIFFVETSQEIPNEQGIIHRLHLLLRPLGRFWPLYDLSSSAPRCFRPLLAGGTAEDNPPTSPGFDGHAIG